MQWFKNILVFTDGTPSDRVVLERAAAVAQRSGALLTALSVLERLPRDLQLLGAAVQQAELGNLAVAEREEMLYRLTADTIGATTRWASKVLVGSPTAEIIGEVLRNEHDLLMIGACDAARTSVFGSTSRQLMRKCPCPFWVVQPGSSRYPRRVLAAVDAMTVDRKHTELNRRILHFASRLAQIEQSQLYVMNAWLPVTEPISVFGRLPLAAPELVAEVRREHGAALTRLLQHRDLKPIEVEAHLVRGDARIVIPKFACEKQIDLIVMGTEGRTGVRGLIARSTAETVLRKVSCSVVTVRLEDSTSPAAFERRHSDADRQVSHTATGF